MNKLFSLRVLLLVFPCLTLLENAVRENEMNRRNILRNKNHKNENDSMIQRVS